MGFHTFPIERAEALDDPGRYRYCSREELLELLDLSSEAVVADLGSGTGFYTSDVAPLVDTIYAIDVQPEMHRLYQEKGIPNNTHLVSGDVSALPLAHGTLDAAYSIMTHHEFADAKTVADLWEVIRPGGTLVTIDWTADGSGAEGPPRDERYGTREILDQLTQAGFEIDVLRERPETVAIVASRSD